MIGRKKPETAIASATMPGKYLGSGNEALPEQFKCPGIDWRNVWQDDCGNTLASTPEGLVIFHPWGGLAGHPFIRIAYEVTREALKRGYDEATAVGLGAGAVTYYKQHQDFDPDRFDQTLEDWTIKNFLSAL